MNILEQIVEQRRADAVQMQSEIPMADLRSAAMGREHHSLIESLADQPGTRIIAELKKASPSAGVLVENYEPAEIARLYADTGAAGISVLTEPRHFMGSLAHLETARASVAIPILRKDFLCHPYHLCQAAAHGADVVLLIVAALERAALTDLYQEATDLGLESLVEAHTPDELDAALTCKHAILGVNSRDLTTLKTNLQTARDMARGIPPDRVSIAESGIRTRHDIEELESLGYNGFLVGESLLRADDPALKLTELLGQ